jgi:SAM-dependent methyltransferase
MPGTRIPNHNRLAEAESEAENDSLRRLNDLAVRTGWRSALDEVYHSQPGAISYATDPARSRFVDLLPITRESTILEIGTSLGQITTELARRAGFVHGLEVVPTQAEFADERCRQEGLSNVAIACGGDDCHLPYEDGQFDGVVINLVIEWCGQRDHNTTLVDCQRRLLSESRRVLRPGAWLFVTTKNRFGLRYLQGNRDEHTYGWRFGQALPRPLLALLLRWRGKTRPEGWIHSYGAFRRELTAAGFTELQSYWAVPEYRYPREFVPTDAASIKAARKRADFVKGENRCARLLMPLLPASLVKYVTPGLVFLGKKPA